MSEQKAQLDYGHRPPRQVQKMVQRWLIRAAAATLVVTILFSGWLLWQRCERVYWQRQCMNYAAPADQIVYQDDPAGVATLLGPGSGYVALPKNWSPSAPYTTTGRAVAKQRPKSLERYDQFWLGKLTRVDPVLFLHNRRTALGVSRLVCITFDGFGLSGGLPSPQFSAELSEPGTVRSGVGGLTILSPLEGGIGADAVARATRTKSRIRFYAGQPDISDASHFTISYEIGDTMGTIDGWLIDDAIVGPWSSGVKVKLSVRNGPATQPSS